MNKLYFIDHSKAERCFHSLDMWYFYEKELLTDVVLNFTHEGNRKQEIRCHRLVLCAASPVFYNMLVRKEEGSMNWLESSSLVIDMSLSDNFWSAIGFDVVKQVIDYLYTRKIRLTVHNLIPVQMVAHMYQLDSLMSACTEALKEHIQMENVVSMMHYANTLMISNLESACIQFIARHFQEIALVDDMRRELFSLPQSTITEMLSSNQLSIDDECQLCHFLCEWAQHPGVEENDYLSTKTKREQFDELLCACLRLPTATRSQLDQLLLQVDNVERLKWLKESSVFRVILSEALEHKQQPKIYRDQQTRFQRRLIHKKP